LQPALRETSSKKTWEFECDQEGVHLDAGTQEMRQRRLAHYSEEPTDNRQPANRQKSSAYRHRYYNYIQK
jgi:hypothetical protein